MLTRYWFTFLNPPAYSPLHYGCGVTATDYSDALRLIQRNVFSKVGDLKINQVIPNITVDQLEQGHVMPNMGVIVIRGVWFPKGYEELPR
jgi:hypothetical protein